MTSDEVRDSARFAALINNQSIFEELEEGSRSCRLDHTAGAEKCPLDFGADLAGFERLALREDNRACKSNRRFASRWLARHRILIRRVTRTTHIIRRPLPPTAAATGQPNTRASDHVGNTMSVLKAE